MENNVFLMAIWNIRRTFGMYGHLAIWYIFTRFGLMCQEKSGNPDKQAGIYNSYIYKRGPLLPECS
jgi:hypothetical protein